MKKLNIRLAIATLLGTSLVAGGLYTLAAANSDPLTQSGLPSEIIQEIAPLQGVRIVPLAEQNLPPTLRNVYSQNISQMNRQGYVEIKKVSNRYDKLAKDSKKLLKPLNEIKRNLAIQPAELKDSSLNLPNAKLLGARLSGTLVDGKATGVFRLMVVPGLGVVGLNEVDYSLSFGGMSLIEEAINHEINGNPAVLTVKRIKGNNGESELIWATNSKIYTLTSNKALVGDKSVQKFIDFANSISQ